MKNLAPVLSRSPSPVYLLTSIPIRILIRLEYAITYSVVFMYMGELVEHGPAHEVFDRPCQARTRAYLDGQF
jgi:ABC-type microcin C transport system duplicated ATPase subunit YejF